MIRVFKTPDGTFRFSSDPLSKEEAKKIDVALSEAGFVIEREVEKPPVPKYDENKLRRFYEEAGS